MVGRGVARCGAVRWGSARCGVVRCGAQVVTNPRQAQAGRAREAAAQQRRAACSAAAVIAREAARGGQASEKTKKEDEIRVKWKVLQHAAVVMRQERIKEGTATAPREGWYEETMDSDGARWLQVRIGGDGVLPPKDISKTTDTLAFLQDEGRAMLCPAGSQQMAIYRRVIGRAKRGLTSTPKTKETQAMKDKHDIVRRADTHEKAQQLEAERRVQLGSTREVGSKSNELQKFEIWVLYSLGRLWDFIRWDLHNAIGSILRREDALQSCFAIWCSWWVERQNTVAQIMSAFRTVHFRIVGIVVPPLPQTAAVLEELKALMNSEGSARRERDGLSLRHMRFIAEFNIKKIDKLEEKNTGPSMIEAEQLCSMLVILGAQRDKGWRAGNIAPGDKFNPQHGTEGYPGQKLWTGAQRIFLGACEEGDTRELHPTKQKGEAKRRNAVDKDILTRAQVFCWVPGDETGMMPALARLETLAPLDPAAATRTAFLVDAYTRKPLDSDVYVKWLKKECDALFPNEKLVIGKHSGRIGVIDDVRARTSEAALVFGQHSSGAAAAPYAGGTTEGGAIELAVAVQGEKRGDFQPSMLQRMGHRADFSTPQARPSEKLASTLEEHLAGKTDSSSRSLQELFKSVQDSEEKRAVGAAAEEAGAEQDTTGVDVVAGGENGESGKLDSGILDSENSDSEDSNSGSSAGKLGFWERQLEFGVVSARELQCEDRFSAEDLQGEIEALWTGPLQDGSVQKPGAAVVYKQRQMMRTELLRRGNAAAASFSAAKSTMAAAAKGERGMLAGAQPVPASAGSVAAVAKLALNEDGMPRFRSCANEASTMPQKKENKRRRSASLPPEGDVTPSLLEENEQLRRDLKTAGENNIECRDANDKLEEELAAAQEAREEALATAKEALATATRTRELSLEHSRSEARQLAQAKQERQEAWADQRAMAASHREEVRQLTRINQLALAASAPQSMPVVMATELTDDGDLAHDLENWQRYANYLRRALLSANHYSLTWEDWLETPPPPPDSMGRLAPASTRPLLRD